MSNMVVRTNVLALNSHRNLGLVGNQQARASARLSSGFRINSAADDAAGLSISEGMRAQIRGMAQASRNAQDGISLIQTAEGYMQTVTEMIQRARELATQAANDTYHAENRATIANEINHLEREIQRIWTTATFNGQNLFGGAVSTDGDPVRQVIDLAAMATAISATGHADLADRLGDDALSLTDAQLGLITNFINANPDVFLVAGAGGNITNLTPGVADLVIAINAADATVNVHSDNLLTFLNEVRAAFAAAVPIAGMETVTFGHGTTPTNAEAFVSGLWSFDHTTSAHLPGNITIGTGMTEEIAGHLNTWVNSVTLEQWQSVAAAQATAAITNLAGLQAVLPGGAIPSNWGNLGAVDEAANVWSSDASSGGVGLTAAQNAFATWVGANAGRIVQLFEGRDPVEIPGTDTENGDVEIDGDGLLAGTFHLQVGPDTGNPIGTGHSLQVNVIAQVAALEADIAGSGAGFWTNAALGGVGEDPVVLPDPATGGTHATWTAAINIINDSLQLVNDLRSSLGAYQNRLEFTIENLDIARENLSASESRIRDADMAAEMMALTQANVLQQAATAMLAQANQAPQSILQLLG